MSGQDDDTEREHEPSQRKLDEARKRGDVARSADLNSAAVYGGFLLAVLVAGAGAIKTAANAGMTLIGQADTLAPSILSAGRAPTMGMLMDFILPFASFFVLPLIAALLSVAAQRGLIFAPEKLAPQLSRINPLVSFGQKFGREGLFTFFKSLTKLIVVCVLVFFLMSRHQADMFLSMQSSPGQSSLLMMSILNEFLMLSLLITLVFGGFDYGWQWFATPAAQSDVAPGNGGRAQGV